jgi:hypothetical protein
MNPYGYRLLLCPFELTGLQLFMQIIHEWRPPYHSSYNSSTMFFFYVVHIGALSATFFAVQRDPTLFRAGRMPCNVANLLIAAILMLAYAVMA